MAHCTLIGTEPEIFLFPWLGIRLKAGMGVTDFLKQYSIDKTLNLIVMCIQLV